MIGITRALVFVMSPTTDQRPCCWALENLRLAHNCLSSLAPLRGAVELVTLVAGADTRSHFRST
jgi:hypothetical protein